MTPYPALNAILVVGGLTVITWLVFKFGDVTPSTATPAVPKPRRGKLFRFGRRRKFVGYRCPDHALTGMKPGYVCLLDTPRCTICVQNQSSIAVKNPK